MRKRVEKYIIDNSLINRKENIVVGVSGGADSMCLLYLLKSFQKDYKIQLVVAHINHGMRKEAKEDALFVQQTCTSLDIPYEEHNCNIIQLAKENKCSEEVIGRKERYWFFEQVRRKYKANKIAVAHTMNDQAETMLMRLIRGSGITGLGAMAVRRDLIIRPLLIISREEVEEYCQEHHIEYQEDKTNKMDLYTRNKLRRHVLPLLKKEFNPNVVETMARTALQFQETEEYLEVQTEKAYQSLVREYKTGYSIKIKPFLEYHSVIQGRIIRLVITNHLGALKDISYQNINDVIDLFSKQSGKRVSINDQTIAIREHGDIRIIQEEKSPSYSYNLAIGINELVQCDKRIEIVLRNDSQNKQRHENAYTKNIDYDKMNGNLQIRNRQAGDRILLRNGSKKLKDFFIDEKIPRTCRDDVLLIADEKNIIWIVGYRLSEAYYVTDHTKRVLQIRITDLLTQTNQEGFS